MLRKVHNARVRKIALNNCSSDCAFNIFEDAHKIAVRGLFGDSLNSAIDFIRKTYYKAKDLLSSAKVC